MEQSNKFKYIYDEKADLDVIQHAENGSGFSVCRLGGELISYRIYQQSQKKLIPILYRDGLVDPPAQGWKNHATILFPIVGRIKNNTSLYKGNIKISSKANHGFARHSKFNLESKTFTDNEAILKYQLIANQETLSYYPFQFKLELIYQFNSISNALSLQFIITNLEKDQNIPFQFGWHPGFKTPFIEGHGKKEDCQLLMNKGIYQRILTTPGGLLTGQNKDYPIDQAVPWTEDDLSGTIILQINNKSDRKTTLFDPAAGIKLHFNFEDLPHLGYWSMKGHNYMCVEPWQGVDDRDDQEPFENKVGIVSLEPSKQDSRKISLSPEFIQQKHDLQQNEFYLPLQPQL